MGKFTSNQKIKIYKCAIVDMKSQFRFGWDINRTGLCLALSVSARGLYGVGFTANCSDNFKEYFPEVYKHKPSHCFDPQYWFSRSNRGINKRIHILETAIKELENG